MRPAADRLVLPALTREQIHGISQAKVAFDTLVRSYIHEHLGYRSSERFRGTGTWLSLAAGGATGSEPPRVTLTFLG
jgi:hypothetical protein